MSLCTSALANHASLPPSPFPLFCARVVSPDSHIVGLSERESDAILQLLYEHSIQPERVVRWKWQKGDLVFWDNRCTAHYAAADYTERRIMHRVTVAGDEPYAPTSAASSV